MMSVKKVNQNHNNANQGTSTKKRGRPPKANPLPEVSIEEVKPVNDVPDISVELIKKNSVENVGIPTSKLLEKYEECKIIIDELCKQCELCYDRAEALKIQDDIRIMTSFKFKILKKMKEDFLKFVDTHEAELG